jgi:heterotetrameric sarcosine oxidase gamma subunit
MADLARSSVAEQIGAGDPAAQAEALSVRLVTPASLALVSSAPATLAPNTRAGDDPYWLWLAPDRALLVGNTAPATPPDGAFVSDVTDGIAVFEIAGARAAEVLAMGGPLDPRGPALARGSCAQTVFAGVKVTLYAYGPEGTFRLHAERSLAAFLLAWFQQAASAFA